MTNYYEQLVQRLREQYMDTKQMLPNVLCHDSADAITALQARVAELSSQRDTAMEMVNVQDNQIDALRALLKVAQDCIYSLDAREIYADELARIDAALAGKDAT